MYNLNKNCTQWQLDLVNSRNGVTMNKLYVGFFLISWILLLYSNKYNLLSSSFIYLMMILILFRNTDLVLIRYFFYAQFFYGLFILIILQELNNKFISTIFLFYVLYGISRFFNNIINGNWQYVSNDVSLLYLNIFDYLTFW